MPTKTEKKTEVVVVVQNKRSITRWESRKINLKRLIPQLEYESFDAGGSDGIEIPLEEATPERIAKEGKKLFESCDKQVEEQLDKKIKELAARYGYPLQATKEDFEGISDIMNSLEKCKTKEELDKITNEIIVPKKNSKELNDAQLSILRRQVARVQAWTK